MASAFGQVRPRSRRRLRIWFTTAVRRITQRSARDAGLANPAASVFIGTSASWAVHRFSNRFRIQEVTLIGLHVRLYVCAGINRTSCPCSRRARPRKCDRLQDSMPVNCTCKFAVKASSCLREHFLRSPPYPSNLVPPSEKLSYPNRYRARVISWDASFLARYRVTEILRRASHYVDGSSMRNPKWTYRDAMTAFRVSVEEFEKNVAGNVFNQWVDQPR